MAKPKALKELILKHVKDEEQTLVEIIRRSSLGCGPEDSMFIWAVGDSVVECTVGKEEIILDEVYRLRDAELTDAEMDALTDDMCQKMDALVSQYWSRAPEPSEAVRLARNNLIRAKFGFYRQVARNQEEAKSYEDVLRNEFSSRADYRAALQPIVTAELGYTKARWEAASGRRNPEVADAVLINCGNRFTLMLDFLHKVFPEE